MFKTEKADWAFIVPSTLVWVAGLAATALDFRQTRRRSAFRFGPLNLLGLALMVVGLRLRRAARRSLRQHFSYGLRLRDDHVLVTSGVYRQVRHPAYTGDMLFHFGVALLFSSLHGLLIMLALIPCFLYRIAVEERMLISRFGDSYRAYRQHTWRLLPPLL
jgi:protein-S-isoprenylcysteine O-methyltransferase Ste14